MNVLILEDEKAAASRLQSLLYELNKGIVVLEVIDTVTQAVHWFSKNESPDLVFFDIQLADGLSFEIFDQVSVDCPIIFTTAYDQYALKAFEVYSIDYLLKPIDTEKLAKALDKYNRIIQKKEQGFDSSIIKEAMEMAKGKTYKERFVVKYGDHLKSIASDEISCFLSEAKASFLYTFSNRKYLVDFSLEQIEFMLDPSKFFRINRKYIIHIKRIKDVVVYSNSRLKVILTEMEDMDMVVAREKVKEFKEWLDQ